MGAQMRDLNDLFRSLDVNHDGKITAAEAKQGLKNLKGCPRDVLDTVVKALDKGGSIDYKNFMAQMISEQAHHEGNHFREMFREIDVNGDGYITIDELPKL